MSLSGNVNLLAGRIASEFNAIRTVLAGKANTGHTHSISDVTGLAAAFTTPQASRVGSATVPSGGATVDIDASNRDATNIDMGGPTTLGVPTNGVDLKYIQIVAYANGAQRTFTFNASYQRLAGIAQTINVPAGKKLRVGIRYSTLGTPGWIVEAAAVTQ